MWSPLLSLSHVVDGMPAALGCVAGLLGLVLFGCVRCIGRCLRTAELPPQAHANRGSGGGGGSSRGGGGGSNRGGREGDQSGLRKRGARTL